MISRFFRISNALKNDLGSISKIGGLRKIRDTKPPCTSHEHNPPTHMVLDPGDYEYTCPQCGSVTKFNIPHIIS